jgi:hypothetical protein
MDHSSAIKRNKLYLTHTKTHLARISRNYTECRKPVPTIQSNEPCSSTITQFGIWLELPGAQDHIGLDAQRCPGPQDHQGFRILFQDSCHLHNSFSGTYRAEVPTFLLDLSLSPFLASKGHSWSLSFGPFQRQFSTWLSDPEGQRENPSSKVPPY